MLEEGCVPEELNIGKCVLVFKVNSREIHIEMHSKLFPSLSGWRF